MEAFRKGWGKVAPAPCKIAGPGATEVVGVDVALWVGVEVGEGFGSDV